MQRDSISMKGLRVICGLALVFLLAVPMDADAQRGRGGPRLEVEDAQAAWDLQAKSVAKDIGLGKKQANKLSEAYAAARKNHQAAMQELRESSGGGRGNFQAHRELSDEERGKLENALKGVAKDGQIEKVLASLGTFDRRWDRLTHTLAGFELESGTLQKAMSLTIAYVSGSYAARQEALESGDREGMREIFREHQSELNDGMAKVLSEEDYTKWTEATQRRGRGGRPGGGRPGGGGGN